MKFRAFGTGSSGEWSMTDKMAIDLACHYLMQTMARLNNQARNYNALDVWHCRLALSRLHQLKKEL